MRAPADRIRMAISDIAARDLDLGELGVELSAAIARVLPHEGYSLIGFDPISGLRTFHTSRNGLRDVERELVHNETVDRDLHRFVDLVRQPRPVGLLGNGGAEERYSTRPHDLLPLNGYAHELRLAIHRRGTLFGALVLLRERRRPAFSDDDAAAATALAQPLVDAIRLVSVRTGGGQPHPLPPGVVIVRGDGTAESISSTAYAWLADLHLNSPLTATNPLPWVVVEAAAKCRAGTRGHALSRIRTRAGRWLSLSANTLDDGRVVVTLHPATLGQLLPAVAAWHELTRREGEILMQLAAGRASGQIAHRLRISPHTVDDHLKAIYRKSGTSSRDQLLARLR